MKVDLYFMQIWDLNGALHEIKTGDIDILMNFVRRNRGPVLGVNKGHRKVPDKKLQHCIDNVSIENLMTLPKEEG